MFRADLQRFVGTCRVVRGLRNLRVGALGARPTAFNTVRYSEKLLEQSGISVEQMGPFKNEGAAVNAARAAGQKQRQSRQIHN